MGLFPDDHGEIPTAPHLRDYCKWTQNLADVGPLSRQLLTRAEGFFGNRFSLTLCDKLIRGKVPE